MINKNFNQENQDQLMSRGQTFQSLKSGKTDLDYQKFVKNSEMNIAKIQKKLEKYIDAVERKTSNNSVPEQPKQDLESIPNKELLIKYRIEAEEYKLQRAAQDSRQSGQSKEQSSSNKQVNNYYVTGGSNILVKNEQEEEQIYNIRVSEE